MGELLLCPFCGAKPCEDIQNGYIQKADGSFYQHVWCDTCNASGGEFKTAEEAIERWNTRPRTEGRGEGEPVAYMLKTASSGHRPVLASYVDAWREKGVEVDAQPLYASPIREPEISREAETKLAQGALHDADDISGRIHAGGYRANLSDVECLRNHVRRLARAILNLAPVAKGVSHDADLSDEFDRPGRLSDATRHSAEGTADPALSGARGVGEGWRPIETAPKDGTAFMVWAGGYEWPEVVRWEAYSAEDAEEIGEPGYWTYAESLMADATDDCGSKHWTAWQPLPPPPQEKGGMK